MGHPNHNHHNRLLDQLSARNRKRLLDRLEPVRFDFKEPLYEQNQRIEHIYFPLSGVISIVTDLSEGETIETGTIGREGLIGLPAVFGAERAPWRAFCQIPGEGLRIRANAFKQEVEEIEPLRTAILRYANAVMAMMAQSAACIGAHAVEERMCRWLLMTHDRVDSDEFPLTQEFLGQMLGARRPTVSLAGSALQRAGLIAYTRGRIAVLDRKGLEEASCECYAFVKRQFDEALGQDTSL